jgi:hypothetical protein
MNIKFYIEKLENSGIYKKFIKENPDAFLCSGFFVIDKQGSDNKQHLDFFVPEKNSTNGKTFSFQIDKEINLVPIEERDNIENNKNLFPKPKKLDFNYDFDFNEIEEIIQKKMEENKIKNTIQKYLFSLQKVENRDYLIGTVFISMLGLIKVNISLPEKKVMIFEKRSIFEIVKKG